METGLRGKLASFRPQNLIRIMPAKGAKAIGDSDRGRRWSDRPEHRLAGRPAGVPRDRRRPLPRPGCQSRRGRHAHPGLRGQLHGKGAVHTRRGVAGALPRFCGGADRGHGSADRLPPVRHPPGRLRRRRPRRHRRAARAAGEPRRPGPPADGAGVPRPGAQAGSVGAGRSARRGGRLGRSAPAHARAAGRSHPRRGPADQAARRAGHWGCRTDLRGGHPSGRERTGYAPCGGGPAPRRPGPCRPFLRRPGPRRPSRRRDDDHGGLDRARGRLELGGHRRAPGGLRAAGPAGQGAGDPAARPGRLPAPDRTRHCQGLAGLPRAAGKRRAGGGRDPGGTRPGHPGDRRRPVGTAAGRPGAGAGHHRARIHRGGRPATPRNAGQRPGLGPVRRARPGARDRSFPQWGAAHAGDRRRHRGLPGDRAAAGDGGALYDRPLPRETARPGGWPGTGSRPG